MTAQLLIGPVLRRVDGDRATLWLETSEPAAVRVEVDQAGAGSARTFSAYGHHYSIVTVEGLAPDSANSYRLFLDERLVWPDPESDYPPSVIRTRSADDTGQPVSLLFGSCREATPESSRRRLPPDALDAYSRRLMTDPETRPDLLVLLGDQVYADETSKKVRRFIRLRRAAGYEGPADQVVTFEEYTKLYLESWRDPEVRWLLATVPSVMIFDDHEIIDDWNTSASWRADMARQPWWRERISAGLASYWIYQHLGNLSPDELAADPLLQKVTSAEDATDLLHEFGLQVDDPEAAENTDVPYQWSYALDLGRTRLVVLDNRCNRVLTPGARSMLPAAEWNWFLDQAHGDYDHLVIGSSLPWLMPPAIHYLEAWNEQLAESPNRRAAAFGEKVRRAFDLEHWAAFGKSFAALGELFRRLGEGTIGEGKRVGTGGVYAAPASISVLSGDVHHSYLARADFGTAMVTPVFQLTCSPIHNEVPLPMRPLMRIAWTRTVAHLVRGLALTEGVRKPALRWKRLAKPYFGNAVGTLRLDGRKATARIEGTTGDGALHDVASVDYQPQDRSSTLRR